MYLDLLYPLNPYSSFSFSFSSTIMSSLDVGSSESIFPSMLAKGDFLIETVVVKIPFFKLTSVKIRYNFINAYIAPWEMMQILDSGSLLIQVWDLVRVSDVSFMCQKTGKDYHCRPVHFCYQIISSRPNIVSDHIQTCLVHSHCWADSCQKAIAKLARKGCLNVSNILYSD